MRVKQSCVFLAFIGGGLFSIITTHPAQAITWKLDSVSFSDGGTASGSFDYNANNNYYSNINIAVTGPLYNNQTVFFNPSDVIYSGSSKNGFSVCKGNDCYANNPAFVNLAFLYPLTNSGGTIKLINEYYGFSSSGVGGTTGFVSTLSTSPQPVPFGFSPTFGILLGLPLFLGIKCDRKKRFFLGKR